MIEAPACVVTYFLWRAAKVALCARSQTVWPLNASSISLAAKQRFSPFSEISQCIIIDLSYQTTLKNSTKGLSCHN
jgi:hypothetical protein